MVAFSLAQAPLKSEKAIEPRAARTTISRAGAQTMNGTAAAVGEWMLLAGVLVGVAWWLPARWSHPRARLLTVGLFALGLAGAGAWQVRLQHRLTSRTSVTTPTVGRAEYTGSDNCRACHPDQYATWHRSYHRTMTQVAAPETVRGKFDNVDLEFQGDRYHLERRGDEFWVDMVDPEWRIRQEEGVAARHPDAAHTNHAPRVWRRISLVTGSHYMQAYWIDNQHGNQQLSLPFTYLFEGERWVPRPSVFIRDPDAKGWAQVWNLGCVDCHATAGQPGKLPAPASFATRTAEFGIACEACHGPGEEHVRRNSDPLRRYALHQAGHGDPTMVNPARLNSKRASEICGRCHSIHSPHDDEEWTRTGTQFRPGGELETNVVVNRHMKSVEKRKALFWSDDMVRVSGREYNGLIKSPCYLKGDLSCLSCHSSHQSSPVYQVATNMDGNAACTPCHQPIAAKLQAHTHHAPGSSGSLCYNCHMPYTTYGLMKALRSHQISSPSVKSSLDTGRPNACNLCHLDQTLAWTGRQLQTWYGTPPVAVPPEHETIAASILWATQGDAGQRALAAWHLGWEPARAVSGNGWSAPYLAALLEDPYPAVRFMAARSLRLQPGFAGWAYDHIAPPATLHQAAEAALTAWETAPANRPAANPCLLLQPGGRLDRAALTTLRQGRNNRIVELNE